MSNEDMTIEEAKDFLNHYICCCPYGTSPTNCGDVKCKFGMAVRILCDDARPTGEWISVSERLPEDMQRVLVWFEYYRYGDFNCMWQTYGFGYVCDGEWSSFINGETGWQDSRIIAWQPLPEPYKEADNEG